MTSATKLSTLMLLSSVLGSAASLSGTLVDSKCYAGSERNVNPTDTLTSVDRDTNSELRYCAPRAKTMSFTLVLTDGQSFRLDAAGNLKAADLVRSNGKSARLFVSVNGEVAKNTIRVESISPIR